jgi:hypothetical protein
LLGRRALLQAEAREHVRPVVALKLIERGKPPQVVDLPRDHGADERPEVLAQSIQTLEMALPLPAPAYC